MPRLELYPFRYRSEVTGKWVKARYVAELQEIAARYAPGAWEIVGPPEIRNVDPTARSFSPFPKIVPHTELVRMKERPPEIQPHLAIPPAIDELERFLVLAFLRRYIAYCARRRRYAAMNGAARLLESVRATKLPRFGCPVIGAT